MRKYFRLKEFRSDYGLKQIDIAETFKCHQTNISRIEGQLCDLEDYQYKILYEKYGQETVDKYKVVESGSQYSTSRNAVNATKIENDMSAEKSDVEWWGLVRSQNAQINSLIEQNKALTEAVNNLTKMLGGVKVG